MRVKPAELAEAHAKRRGGLLEVIRQVRYNVVQFQSGCSTRDAVMPVSGKHELHVHTDHSSASGVLAPAAPRRTLHAPDDGVPGAGGSG